jgi:hypothetical protein
MLCRSCISLLTHDAVQGNTHPTPKMVRGDHRAARDAASLHHVCADPTDARFPGLRSVLLELRQCKTSFLGRRPANDRQIEAC